MSTSTEHLSRRLREQSAAHRNTTWTDADRLTNCYLLLELAATVIREYSSVLAEAVEVTAVDVLDLARIHDRYDGREEYIPTPEGAN